MSNQTAQRPVLFLEEALDESGQRAVAVGGLDQGLLASIRSDARVAIRLREAFKVAVRGDTAVDLPAVSGSYEIGRDTIRFLPDLPFDPAVTFRARFDPQRWGRLDLDPLQFEFAFPRPRASGRPSICAIYPSADVLPENLLRFYICFSTPMRHGAARSSVAILDAAGDVIPDILYPSPVELWDPGMRRLTILLDPGRLKRGVGPNRDLGPPLKCGTRYRLAISDAFRDANGEQLTPAVKDFQASEPVREAIDPGGWSARRPTVGTRQPLVLAFRRALDWAGIRDSLAMASGHSHVKGSATISRGETQWSFLPDEPWSKGCYSVQVRAGLEDVCGNRVGAAFDRNLRLGANLRAEDSARSISFDFS